MSKYTKGPWKIDLIGQQLGIIAEKSEGDWIICYLAKQKERVGNARLITAAPEMYEAIKEILQFVDHELPPDMLSRLTKAVLQVERNDGQWKDEE